MTNKYVDFVSDDDFLKEVKHVVDSYPDKDEDTPSPLKLLKNYEYGILQLPNQ